MPFTETEKAGGKYGVVVGFFFFGKGGIGSSISDMLNLRCLLGHSTADVKRQLEIYESGVQERGLGWLCKAVRLNEISKGLSLDRKEKRTKDHTLGDSTRQGYGSIHAITVKSSDETNNSIHHTLSMTFLFLSGGN